MVANRSRKSPKSVGGLKPKKLSAKQARGVQGGSTTLQSQTSTNKVSVLCDGSVNKVVNARG